MNPDLNGKVSIVTGSTSGIGLAVANALAAAGSNIVINGLGSAEENEPVRKQVADDHGVNCIFVGANLIKPEGPAELVQAAVDEFGGIDILVNNAGMQYVAPVEEFPPEKWDAIIALNLSAAFHGMAKALPIMRERGWGRIISTASAHSLVASPYKAAYVSAKHGLYGLTKTIALECAADGVTVNCISPGYVWTPLVEEQIPDTMKARSLTRDEVINDVLLSAQPTKQFVTVEEVAGTVLYLCSDTARNVTGANMVLDGGWTAQ
ncbi:3-hydroxybutyrate dehydrogenase [Tepidamorphus sp. 3E244]|uniref:3-hydroxybutyrate dehydrogenase n=1 Tax=Tepidamorphus sp. 3E244 TaxID=3385498 RepID=UPI0038FCA30C